MFSLPDLPYPYEALEPVISAEALRLHHQKHHAGYVTKTNALVKNLGIDPDNLESLIGWAIASSDAKLFDVAAQAWNHGFFWEAMSPDRQRPTGEVEVAIKAAFGDLAGLKAAFVAEGAGRFGSGWVWLVADLKGALRVLSTHDAGSVLTDKQLMPMLVCDVWEHAYYLDHRNDRQAYLETWFDTLPNWAFAESQLAAARDATAPWGYAPPTHNLAAA